jgi:hypothetical protein
MARRAAVGALSEAWDEERRRRYLLRTDAPQPLSVDVWVWPAAEIGEGVRVAVTMLFRGSAKGDERYARGQISVDEEVDFLGYDIADASLTSGLSNTAYTEEERARLAPVWAPRLNRFHLFDEAEHALEFKAVSDARVPEHAPFFVYGIYRISSEIPGSGSGSGLAQDKKVALRGYRRAALFRRYDVE